MCYVCVLSTVEEDIPHTQKSAFEAADCHLDRVPSLLVMIKKLAIRALCVCVHNVYV